MQMMQAPDRCLSHTANPFGIQVDIQILDMRTFLAILGLVLCLIAARACELPVIKDSEAIQFVGRNVEVRGFVVSVMTSPLGTAFINFGRDYPNQTFAGFIAAGSKMENDERITMLPGRIIGITGTIELYEGRPEIEVTSTGQIKSLGSASEMRRPTWPPSANTDCR
jgi:hypothetical protein